MKKSFHSDDAAAQPASDDPDIEPLSRHLATTHT